MKAFTSILFLGVFLVLIAMPEMILADRKPFPAPGPHQVFYSCGTWCENNCINPHAQDGPCRRMCKMGNFCVDGYIRESPAPNARCILPIDCPSRQTTGHPTEKI